MENKTKWVIDPAHSEIAFKVKHLMITNVKGHFKMFDATVFTEDSDFSKAEVSFKMDTSSVDTGSPDRDTHLKSSDFFDVEKYKEILYTSKKVERQDEENFKMSGDLTIKGITKPVDLDVEFGGIVKDPWGNEKAGFAISGKINRKDWNLLWNVAIESGGFLVGDDVNINCEVQMLKPKDH